MEHREEANLENMALAAELARQLCHEFSNFLYNLLLQIEIGETSQADASHKNWASIKGDAKKITRLMQEWDGFHDRFAFSENEVDLHAVIRRMASQASVQDHTLHLSPTISGTVLPIVNSEIDCRHLLRLLVEDVAKECRGAAEEVPAVSLDTERTKTNVTVRITACMLDRAPKQLTEEETLLAAACRALAVRVGANIHRERNDDSRLLVLVEFPQ